MSVGFLPLLAEFEIGRKNPNFKHGTPDGARDGANFVQKTGFEPKLRPGIVAKKFFF